MGQSKSKSKPGYAAASTSERRDSIETNPVDRVCWCMIDNFVAQYRSTHNESEMVKEKVIFDVEQLTQMYEDMNWDASYLADSADENYVLTQLMERKLNFSDINHCTSCIRSPIMCVDECRKTNSGL